MILQPLLAEVCRLHLMRGLESLLAGAGYGLVAGVDEAGRGAWAGPVVAAAVIMDPGAVVPGVDDSKELEPVARQQLARSIRSAALGFGVAAVEARTIDSSRIVPSTRSAMVQALTALDPKPDIALIDAVALEGLPFPVLPLIRGDQISYSIACASILAKVERDRLMGRLGNRYPQYGFSRHKGYGAAEHRAALDRFGPSPEHRLTFRGVVPSRVSTGAR